MASRYEIVVAGEVGPLTLAALDGFVVRPGDAGSSRMVGLLEDQAALHGALRRLDDLHVELIEVRRVDIDEPGPPTSRT